MSTPFIRQEHRHPWLLSRKLKPEYDYREWVSADGKQHCETMLEGEEREETCTDILQDGGKHSRAVARLYKRCDYPTPCGVCGEPRCGRIFRVNFIAATAKVLTEQFGGCILSKVTVVPILGKFAVGKLKDASFAKIKAHARSRLVAAGLEHVQAIGAVDISFNEDAAKEWEPHWQLHLHYIAIGPSKDELHAALKDVYKSDETILSPVKVKAVDDLRGGISYTHKSFFSRRVSYRDAEGHRDARSGLPINNKQRLRELLRFLSTQSLSSRVFLRRFRRRGRNLEPMS